MLKNLHLVGENEEDDLYSEYKELDTEVRISTLQNVLSYFSCRLYGPGWKTCMNFPTRSCERLDLARCELRADPKIGCELRVKLKLMR